MSLFIENDQFAVETFIREDLFCDKPSHHPDIPSRNKINKPWTKLWLKVSFFYWMTMRIFIPRACWSRNLPLRPVNIPVFVAVVQSVVQTSIVVYSERRQRLNTILGNYNTSPGQSVVRERERGRESTMAWFYCDQRHQLIKTWTQLEQILHAGPN